MLLIVSPVELDLTSHVVDEDPDKAETGSHRDSGAATKSLTDLDTGLRLWQRNAVYAATTREGRESFAFAIDSINAGESELSFASTSCERRFSLEAIDG